MTPLPAPLAAILRHDEADPGWQDRDRLLCARDLPDGRQALGVAAGLAHAERLMAQRHGRSLVDHRVWLLADAADLACGAALEVAAACASLQLERLAVILSCREQEVALLALFAAAGWTVRRVRQESELESAVSASQRSRRPSLIACPARLVAGCTAEAEEAAPNEPGREPAREPGREPARELGRSGATARRAWLKRLARHGGRCDFERAVAGRLPPRWHEALGEQECVAPGKAATAAILRAAVARLAGRVGELCLLQEAAAWQGRVQAMGGVLCGLALHGGLLPVGTACLGEADSLLPSLRLAAAQGLRVVHVLAEPDGRGRVAGIRAALRAIPNLLLFRPADSSEAIECLEIALRRADGPSVLLVSEAQGVPLSDLPSRTHASRGGYLVRGAGLKRDVTLLASGRDMAEALAAAEALAGEGIVAAVASIPSWTLFAQQDPGWRGVVLGQAPRVAIERGSGFGWACLTGPGGLFIDPDAPGAAPARAIRRFLLKREDPCLSAGNALLEKAGDAG